MSGFASLRAHRRMAAAIISTSILLGSMNSAVANDGLSNFFSSIFGDHHQQSYAPQVQDPDGSASPLSPPLTVKLHRPKARAAQIPTKPEKVSIFEDRTLRRGDAVMTRHGMRIFAGSNNWPYQDDDFVAIAAAGRMDKGLQKTLISLDSLPRTHN